MTLACPAPEAAAPVDPLVAARAALGEAEAGLDRARAGLRSRTDAPDGRISNAALEAAQREAHGLAWAATYVEALRRTADWAERLEAAGTLGEVEALILSIAFGEYLAQLRGGLPLGPTEFARLPELAAAVAGEAAQALIAHGTADAPRRRLAGLMAEADGAATIGACGLDDELDMIRDQFRRFVADRVAPHAHGWHRRDALIPMEVVEEMAALGVFGLTIPEAFGGAGFGKIAMCVVSEELSRGHLGVGSLGTRAEIAAELILCGGTEAQKAEWLPKLATGATLPTAVFTEPDAGSDLGALRARARRDGEGWAISGNKTWITHAARADLMTVLARTDPESEDWRGLSMFLAPKTRGTDTEPFPDPTLSGGEIEVLGYRGMKEYTLAFDEHRVGPEALLGGVEGQGFKQLMRTFESARIQTAARAVGVAQNALELSLAYAQDRRAFGRPLIEFPRVWDKLAMAAVETMLARQLTYHAAREKDGGRRCDLEAGMAKLLAARVAWSAADNGVQIHGGNGFAQESPISRVLCDARILSIFEGAAEIQAQVIARRLLERA
jgi:(2S)-methylsuccinyl-CoA dehydrogenase